MTVILNPYLTFETSAEAAFTWYQSVFGGELVLSRFRDMDPASPEEIADLVMHAHLTAPDGLVLMGADTPSDLGTMVSEQPVSISLSGTDAARLNRFWDLLSIGATIEAALEKAPWGDTFGMLVDQYGVRWMVNILAVGAAGKSK